MGDHGRTRSADILRHADLRLGDLGVAALRAQLLNHFNQLIHPRRPNRMSPRFQPAACRYRNFPVRRDLIL